MNAEYLQIRDEKTKEIAELRIRWKKRGDACAK